MNFYIELLQREALLMPHTYDRMVERGISIDDLKELLESKSSTAVMQKNGRMRISNERIVAILQLSFRDLYIVTVFRNEKLKE
ncbi:MAG TPA: DUF4258 domain-containing protein [Fervidobacterium sp.]|nr:DUF4258 domain-containing protein [Fervidobacterium sp.]